MNPFRRRRQPAAVALVAKGHLADFARRRDLIAPRRIYVRDPVAERLAAHGIKVDELPPDEHLYGNLDGLR